MTHVAPLPPEAITDPEMLDLMAQSAVLGMPNDLFPRIVLALQSRRSHSCVRC